MDDSTVSGEEGSENKMESQRSRFPLSRGEMVDLGLLDGDIIRNVNLPKHRSE